MNTPAEGGGNGIARTMEQRSIYVYKEQRDANNPVWDRTLEYMVLATIRQNSNITENQLCGLMRSVYFVPEDMTRRTIRMWQNSTLPNNANFKVLFTEPVPRRETPRSEPPSKTNVHLKLSPRFDFDAFTKEYSAVVGHDLSEYLPEIYNKPTDRPRGDGRKSYPAN